MKTFEGKGTANGKKFNKMVKADNKKMAQEYVYSLIGSKENIPRRKITIEEIKEAK